MAINSGKSQYNEPHGVKIEITVHKQANKQPSIQHYNENISYSAR